MYFDVLLRVCTTFLILNNKVKVKYCERRAGKNINGFSSVCAIRLSRVGDLKIQTFKTPWDWCTVHPPVGDNRVVTENGGLSGILKFLYMYLSGIFKILYVRAKILL